MKILVQFPTLYRKEKFVSCLSKYIALSSGKNDIHFNINCDSGDLSMNNLETVSEIRSLPSKFKKNISLDVFFDEGTTKISAINSHIDSEKFNFDIVICASDDMVPQVKEWDDIIACDMRKVYPDLDGCLHYNDGYQKSNLITLSILGRALYDQIGYIYHPDYKSLYCDNEFTQTVRKLKKVTYIDKCIIKHEHYAERNNINSGDFDLSAKKTLHFSGRDHYVFEKRKELGFPQHRITND